MPRKADHVHHVLEALENCSELSQRALAARLGIALGHANQLLRALVQQHWVRTLPGPRHGLRYVVTDAGAAALARMSREQLHDAVASVGAVRDRVCECLASFAPNGHRNGSDGRPAIVLYGVGDIARIAFACAPEVGVRLVGFVDEIDGRREAFLGLPVRCLSSVKSLSLDGEPFDGLVVASLSNQDGILTQLRELGFPLERVCWV